MSHMIGYNHIGRGRFYTNYTALQEAIAPCGNYYIVDRQVLDNMQISDSFPYEEQYGQYEANGILPTSYQNRKVRQIFTDCNISYKRAFIMPSDHFVFEWNIMDRAGDCPTFDLAGGSTYLPNWNTRIMKELESCIIWYDIDGVSTGSQGNSIDGFQFYIEVQMADWNSNTELYDTNIQTATPWSGENKLYPFLGCSTNTLIDENGIERAGVFNPHKGGSGVMGFSWVWVNSLHNANHIVTSIRIGILNDVSNSGLPSFQNKNITINQIWLGQGLDTYISPNMDVDYWIEYDGIKRKDSISGKTDSTLNYLGSPASDAFGPKSIGSHRAPDFAGDPNLENSMYYVMQDAVNKEVIYPMENN